MVQERILIIGAGGFVGKSLLPYLVKSGYSDFILVDPQPINSQQIRSFKNSEVKILSFVTDRIPRDRDIDQVSSVICLAGVTSVDAALAQPVPTIEGNIKIALDLAEWSRINNESRVIYVSSDEVLGESYSESPLPHDAPYNPTQPYAASKAAAEIILHTYQHVYDLDIITIRSCNLVGPEQLEPKLIPVAVRFLIENNRVPIHGDGKQIREWMAVEDLCEAILLLLKHDSPRGIYQAASGVHLSVNKVVQIVANALGKSLDPVEVKDRIIQDSSYAMKTDRLKSLGWRIHNDPVKAISATAIAISLSVISGSSKNR